MLIGENRYRRVWGTRVRGTRTKYLCLGEGSSDLSPVRATGQEPNGICDSAIRVESSTVLARVPVLELPDRLGSEDNCPVQATLINCNVVRRCDWRIAQLTGPRERPAQEVKPSRTTRLKIQRSDL